MGANVYLPDIGIVSIFCVAQLIDNGHVARIHAGKVVGVDV